jgi:hypothetical protein
MPGSSSGARQRHGEHVAAAGAGPVNADIKPMTRYYVSDGLSTKAPPPQGVASSVVASVTLILFTIAGHAATFILPLLCLATWNAYVIGFTVLLWATTLLPAKRHWPAFLQSWVMQTWREYFDFSFVSVAGLDPEGKYAFGESPHGVFPMGPILAGTVVHLCFPGMTVQAISASNIFRVPLLKHFMSWLGAAPATRENFKMLLKDDCCAVVIGGVAEMCVFFVSCIHAYILGCMPVNIAPIQRPRCGRRFHPSATRACRTGTAHW